MRKSFFRHLLSALACFLVLILVGCFPEQEQKESRVVVDFSNPAQQKIYNFQDRLLADSLSNYFQHEDPTIQFLSTLSFASLGKENALPHINELIKQLDDERIEIRSAAAYALGQIGDNRAEQALIKSFERDDSLNNAASVNRTILEAVGKCGRIENLKAMASVSTYNPTDTLLLEGQALGIYRFGLRGITDKIGTDLMVKFVSDKSYPVSVQLIGAHYLFYNRSLDLEPHLSRLLDAFQDNEDPRIRMVLAVVLGRSKSIVAMQILLSQYPREQDYRVKCNIIRALGNFDYREVEATISSALGNNNYHIANTAAGFFLENGIARDARNYLQKGLSDSTLLEDVRFKLLGAANKYLPISMEGTRGRLVRTLESTYNNTNDIETRSKVLESLSEFGWYYRIIYNLTEGTSEPLILSKVTQLLGKIISRKDFDSFFGLSKRRVRREIAEMLREAIESKDPGAISEAAKILASPELDLKEYFEYYTFLSVAQVQLTLPKETEAYNDLQSAIDLFSGVSKPLKLIPKFNHPINWDIYNEMGTNCKVTLNTDKGKITILLDALKAPGSSINFFQLAKTGFFDGKRFHRVVSNFVIQGGCPRGDGYGSLDYTIRSELIPSYYDQGGMVGMASAGPHTEGTQFFITHAPTPNLDGKYTLFAKVIEGMDVIHAVQPGTIIKSVSISN